MRMVNLLAKTHPGARVFLDGADPDEAEKAAKALGRLDGVTTNPSSLARSPAVKGTVLTDTGLRLAYRDLVREIAAKCAPYAATVGRSARIAPLAAVPFDVSIGVHADAKSRYESLVEQAHEMREWVPGARIALPLTPAGLCAARKLVEEGTNVNMTLCFTQHQAAAVHCATIGAKPWQVLVSPFVGRIDDVGLHGMDLVSNIVSMYARQGWNPETERYENPSSHVGVLAANVRSQQHMFEALEVGADAVTVPASVLLAAERGEAHEKTPRREMVPFYDIDVSDSDSWLEVPNEMTDAGLARLAADWNGLLE